MSTLVNSHAVAAWVKVKCHEYADTRRNQLHDALHRLGDQYPNEPPKYWEHRDDMWTAYKEDIQRNTDAALWILCRAMDLGGNAHAYYDPGANLIDIPPGPDGPSFYYGVLYDPRNGDFTVHS